MGVAIEPVSVAATVLRTSTRELSTWTDVALTPPDSPFFALTRMPMTRRRILTVAGGILVLIGLLHRPVLAQKATYLAYVEETAEREWARYPDVIERWKRNVEPSELWGYDSPAQPIYLADLLGFLYERTGDVAYARRAAQILASYGDLREAYPDDYEQTRAEYDDGVPSLANFFFLPPYSRAYLRLQGSGVLDAEMRATIERDLAYSLDFVFHFPEWGAHNRAMLRAEGLYYGALAMPEHPHAARWKQMAETIASDNLDEWEVEDASHYNAIWLKSLFSYLEISGQEHVFDRPILRYYAEYYKQLFTPARTIADFGDANWNPNWPDYVAVFEKLASRYQDPELKWIAEQMVEKMEADYPQPGVGAGVSLALAYNWTDDSLEPQQPTSRSQEVLEDIVGKKVVFRDGWMPESTYLLLNYRDEGDGGFVHREFLRNTISVEEEKMHHGHSDENSIVLLMDGESVLLHDGGYRSGLPSGPFGQFRADYYHNRIVVRTNKRDRYQTVPEFIRNSGAYRPVRTQKIDFLTFEDVDMSRTRLSDPQRGYTWDRLISYVKPQGFFIVVDAVKATETDYFTFTNLWHTQTIHAQGPQYYDTSIDSIGSVALPQDRRLLVAFLENAAKTDSFYVEQRHFQEEKAIYQTQASHYRAGDYEVFVTALVPHAPDEPVAPYLEQLKVIRPPSFPQAVGVEIDQGDAVSYLGFKLDLESGVVRENIRPRYTWEAGRTRYGDLETDAHFIYATVSDGAIRYAASEVLKVRYDGQVLMEALPNTHGLQPDGADDRVGYVKWRFWEDEVPLSSLE